MTTNPLRRPERHLRSPDQGPQQRRPRGRRLGLGLLIPGLAQSIFTSVGVMLTIGLALAWPTLGSAASCTISPSNPTVNTGAGVTWSATYSGFRRTPSYQWSFSGASSSSSSSRTPTVSYANTGTFDTKLKLTYRGTEAACETKATVLLVDSQAPSRPNNLNATGVSSSQIDLKWSASTDNVGVTEYQIFRCQGSSCTPRTKVGTSPTTTFSDTGLAASTTYRYRVRATDAAGNLSSYSSSARATTSSGGPVNQPPTANAGSDQTVTIVAGQSNIAVTLDGSGSSDPDGTISTYTWTGSPNPADTVSPTVTLAAGSYTFTLVVTDNAGASSAADTVNVTVNPAPPVNQPPTANAGPDQTVTIAAGQSNIAVTLDGSGSSDPDGTISTYTWTGSPNPADTVSPTVTLTAGSYPFTLVVTDNAGASSAADTVLITVNAPVQACNPANLNVSINTTSQDGCPDVDLTQSQYQQPVVANTTYSVLAINDLGMHCGDLDTRISSILPPFQVLLAQVIQKGATPVINPNGVSVSYSAAANPNDPILASNVFDGVKENGDTYKTNFWDGVAAGTYDPFYPGGMGITPLATGGFPVTVDKGLPVPNVEDLYIGPDGIVDSTQTGSHDGFLSAVQHAMPGMTVPYAGNVPQEAKERYGDKPFFVNFPFGYVAADVNWFEGAGVPFAAYDDNGRQNAYPLVRVQAKNAAGTVLSTVDTVLPISGEASCTNCHATNLDYTSVHGVANRTDNPTDQLIAAGLPPATSMDDPDSNMPPMVSLEYAADINVLRLHDLQHGARYVSTACDGVPANENCLNTAPAPCTINAANPNGTDANCLTYKALVLNQPAVCQTCHYTPALDLAHVGPKAGPAGSEANGRNQVAHPSNSRVMHHNHGSITIKDRNGGPMFPDIPSPTQTTAGIVTNQPARLTALEDSCYQCHPGTSVKCLRGAMFNGDMLCSDCHGSMLQVGDDFSKNVSPTSPGAFILGKDFYTNPNTPRVPWANEPGCGSCHTGDARSNLAGTTNTLVNTRDSKDNLDGIRLRQAFRTGDSKATPIVPTNKRFAEPLVPASFGSFTNPGAGNPQLYRVSTGHGGVMCEGCHGATHAEWPNANPNGNDNVTAKQLQGHVGTIADCTTCHGTSVPGGSNNLNGPHGLHRIAFDSTPWSSSSVHKNPGESFSNCATCHGGTSRSNSCGTVLSRALSDRTFSGRTIKAGEPVGCAVCHSSSYWNSTCATQ